MCVCKWLDRVADRAVQQHQQEEEEEEGDARTHVGQSDERSCRSRLSPRYVFFPCQLLLPTTALLLFFVVSAVHFELLALFFPFSPSSCMRSELVS